MATSGRNTGSTSASDDELQETMRTRAGDPIVEARPPRPAKTSAAAAFALVFGLAALFCALTGLLAPAAVVFGIIGLVLAVVGIKMAKRTGITGKGVAIGGLVTALIGLILGGVVLAGATAVVNNQKQLDRVQRYIDDARSNLPSTDEVKDKLPGQ
jgi:membrane-bound ClpP family serine protease